jgi:glycerol kinase
MTVLAIDQGTSGTKALVVDGTSVLAVAELPVRPRYLEGGGVEVDPLDLLDTVLAAGRQALADAGDPVVSAVSLANQGETVLAWDPVTGSPLSQAVVWQDRRAEEVCAGLREKADLVAERTGLVLDAYFSAPKMSWLRRHITDEGVVTTTDAWLVQRLTGELVTDATTASRSLLLDLDRLRWDEELLELFGLAAETLPRVVRNDEVVGSTTAFGAPAPVGGLIVDQQAALVAERCLEPGAAKCTFGTGAFVLAATGGTAVRSRLGLTSSAAWSLAGGSGYCLDGQVYTAGSAVRWMVSAGLLESPEELDAASGEDTGGAVFVPGLAGLAAPWWSAGASGALVGLGLATERRHLVRAVVEGVGCQVTALVRAMVHETGVPLQRLRVDGGLTRSRVLMQLQANLLQIPVDCYPSPHATALGAAAMARLASDPALSLPDAVHEWTPAATYEPQWSAERAASTLATWESAVELVLQREEATR